MNPFSQQDSRLHAPVKTRAMHGAGVFMADANYAQRLLQFTV